jgi:hypothetical protein
MNTRETQLNDRLLGIMEELREMPLGQNKRFKRYILPLKKPMN